MASILHWLQDLQMWHADFVAQYCMLFAHEHYSFVFSSNFAWLPLQIAILNFLDVSKLQVYMFEFIHFPKA